MSKVGLSALALASLFVSLTARAQYAGSVVSYLPGTGFSPGFTNPVLTNKSCTIL